MSRDFDVVGGDAAARAAVEAAAPARRWHPVEAAGGLLTSAGCGLRVAPPCAQPSELLTLADGGTMRLTWCVARAHARSAAPLTRARTRQVYRNGRERATRRGNRHSRSRQHVALAIRAHRMRPPRAPRIPHCVRRPARIARHPAHIAANGRARWMARRPPHRRSNTRGDFAHSPPAARRPPRQRDRPPRRSTRRHCRCTAWVIQWAGSFSQDTSLTPPQTLLYPPSLPSPHRTTRQPQPPRSRAARPAEWSTHSWRTGSRYARHAGAALRAPFTLRDLQRGRAQANLCIRDAATRALLAGAGADYPAIRRANTARTITPRSRRDRDKIAHAQAARGRRFERSMPQRSVRSTHTPTPRITTQRTRPTYLRCARSKRRRSARSMRTPTPRRTTLRTRPTSDA